MNFAWVHSRLRRPRFSAASARHLFDTAVTNNLHQIINFAHSWQPRYYSGRGQGVITYQAKVLLHDFLMCKRLTSSCYFRLTQRRRCAEILENRVISWHVSVEPCILEDLDNPKWQVLSFVSHAKEHAENWTLEADASRQIILCLPTKSWLSQHYYSFWKRAAIVSMLSK